MKNCDVKVIQVLWTHELDEKYSLARVLQVNGVGFSIQVLCKSRDLELKGLTKIKGACFLQ